MVYSRYLKDEDGQVFSPINTAKSTYWDTDKLGVLNNNTVPTLYDKINGIQIQNSCNLNDFTETGIYYFNADSNKTYTNIPAGVNGYMFVMRQLQSEIPTIKQIFFSLGSKTNHFQTYTRQGYNTNNTWEWEAWHRYAMVDDVEYNSTDTYQIKTVSTTRYNGCITDGSSSIRFSIPMGKSVQNVKSVKITAELVVRGVNGYLDSSNVTPIKISPTTANLEVSAFIGSNAQIEVFVKKSTAYGNATNNTPIDVQVSAGAIIQLN